jgi:hypothetical protein
MIKKHDASVHTFERIGLLSDLNQAFQCIRSILTNEIILIYCVTGIALLMDNQKKMDTLVRIFYEVAVVSGAFAIVI